MSLKRSYVMVIGGAGYIGSHMTLRLLKEGFRVIVLDNLCTGHRGFVPEDAVFIKGSYHDTKLLNRVFRKYRVETIMHFAASSLVGESVQNPLKYYHNNVMGFIQLASVMKQFKIRYFIFSSTAAVYGEPKRIPIRENDPKEPKNPYGQSKRMVELILEDLANKKYIVFAVLRYFNACGAHESGIIGEKHDPETHLIPNILKSYKPGGKTLTIHGKNYPTPDGTCIRDYVHVDDLCDAHLLALKYIQRKNKSEIFNLGHGKGYSVNHVVRMAEKIVGRPAALKYGPRRSGDPARLVASSGKAKRLLGWRPKRNLKVIVESAWNWEREQS